MGDISPLEGGGKFPPRGPSFCSSPASMLCPPLHLEMRLCDVYDVCVCVCVCVCVLCYVGGGEERVGGRLGRTVGGCYTIIHRISKYDQTKSSISSNKSISMYLYSTQSDPKRATVVVKTTVGSTQTHNSVGEERGR